MKKLSNKQIILLFSKAIVKIKLINPNIDSNVIKTMALDMLNTHGYDSLNVYIEKLTKQQVKSYIDRADKIIIKRHFTNPNDIDLDLTPFDDIICSSYVYSEVLSILNTLKQSLILTI